MGTQFASAIFGTAHYLAAAVASERVSACGLWNCSFTNEVEPTLNNSCKLLQLRKVSGDILPKGSSRTWTGDVPFAAKKACGRGFKAYLNGAGTLPKGAADRVEWMIRHVEYTSQCRDPNAEPPRYLAICEDVDTLTRERRDAWEVELNETGGVNTSPDDSGTTSPVPPPQTGVQDEADMDAGVPDPPNSGGEGPDISDNDEMDLSDSAGSARARNPDSLTGEVESEDVGSASKKPTAPQDTTPRNSPSSSSIRPAERDGGSMEVEIQGEGSGLDHEDQEWNVGHGRDSDPSPPGDILLAAVGTTISPPAGSTRTAQASKDNHSTSPERGIEDEQFIELARGLESMVEVLDSTRAREVRESIDSTDDRVTTLTASNASVVEAMATNRTDSVPPLEEWSAWLVNWLTTLPQNRTAEQDGVALAPYDSPGFQEFLDSEVGNLTSPEIWQLSVLMGVREAVLQVSMIGARQDVYGLIFLIATMVTLASSFLLLAKYSRHCCASLSIYHRRWRQQRADATEAKLNLKAARTMCLLMRGEHLLGELEIGNIEKGGIPPEQGLSSTPGTDPEGRQCSQCFSIYCSCPAPSQLPLSGGRAGKGREVAVPLQGTLPKGIESAAWKERTKPPNIQFADEHGPIYKALKEQVVRLQANPRTLEPKEGARAPLLYPRVPREAEERVFVETPPPRYWEPSGETWRDNAPPRYRDETVVGDITIETPVQALKLIQRYENDRATGKTTQ